MFSYPPYMLCSLYEGCNKDLYWSICTAANSAAKSFLLGYISITKNYIQEIFITLVCENYTLFNVYKTADYEVVETVTKQTRLCAHVCKYKPSSSSAFKMQFRFEQRFLLVNSII